MKEERPTHMARPRQGDKNSAPRPQSMGALVTAVNAERVAGFPSGRLFLDSVEQALAVALVEGHAVRPRSVPMYRGGLTPARVRRVTELVHAEIEGELTLHEVAESPDVSKANFSQMFRKSAGESPI
jgi:AraC family transcriptional regulator